MSAHSDNLSFSSPPSRSPTGSPPGLNTTSEDQQQQKLAAMTPLPGDDQDDVDMDLDKTPPPVPVVKLPPVTTGDKALGEIGAPDPATAALDDTTVSETVPETIDEALGSKLKAFSIQSKGKGKAPVTVVSTGPTKNLDEYEPPDPSEVTETLAASGKLRSQLDPIEAFVEQDRVKLVLKHVQDWAQSKQWGVDPKHVHQEYRKQDRPKGFHLHQTSTKALMAGIPNMVHRSGNLNPETYKHAVAVFWDGRDANQPLGHVSNQNEQDTWLAVRWMPDSQMPYIQLKVTRTDRRPAVVSIFANHLSHKARYPIFMTTGNQATMVARVFQQLKTSRPELDGAATTNQLSETKLQLARSASDKYNGFYTRPRITGDVTEAELQGWCDTMQNGGALRDSELFLATVYSGRGHHLSIFTVYKYSDQNRRKLEFIQQNNFNQYFVSAMRLCMDFGNYWYIKQQVLKFEDDDHTSLHAQFPFDETSAPRWLTTLWGPKKFGDRMDWSADEAESIPEQRAWAPLSAPHVWPNETDLEFMLRLGLARERQCQTRYLLDLFKANEGNIRAKFTMNPTLGNSWLAEISTDIDRSKLEGMLPQSDTPVQVILETGESLRGMVIEKYGNSSANFCVHVTSKRPLVFGTQEYNVTVNFLDDSTAFRRCMQAMLSLHGGHPDRKEGVHLGNLLVGAPIPHDHNVRLAVDPAERDKFTADLGAFGLNTEQMQGAMATLGHATILHGPPGTGKTGTLVAAIQAHLNRGERILVCAPNNEAVNALIGAFDERSDRTIHRGTWAVWKGAYIKPGLKTSPLAPRLTQGMDDETADAFWSQINAEVHNNADDAFLRRGFAYRRWQVVSDILQQGPANRDFGDANRYQHLSQQMRNLKGQDKKDLLSLEDYFNMRTLEWMKVIFCTCSMACHPTLTEYFKPGIIFIDEAAAATTPDLATPLVAFKLRVKRVVLAGDHKQQPPVITSSNANEGYHVLNSPLFERLVNEESTAFREDTRYPVHTLTTQYRMHPDISNWSNETFYGGRLKNAASTTAPNSLRATMDEWFKCTREYFLGDRQRYRMAVDTSSGDGHQIYGSGTSPCNKDEADVVVKMVDALLRFEPQDPGTRKIVPSDIIIVSPYTGQMKEITSRLFGLSNEFGRKVRCWTTNNVQGHEANIVFLSLVQHDENRGEQVGFIWRPQQLNVELTRAKHFQFLVGNFWGWNQAIADGRGQLPHRKFKPFRSLLGDLMAKNDVITAMDLLQAMDSGTQALHRDNGEFPRQFTMSEQRQLELAEDECGREVGEKSKATAFNRAVHDPGTGGQLRPEKKPKGADYHGKKGNRGGGGNRGRGPNRGGGSNQAGGSGSGGRGRGS